MSTKLFEWPPDSSERLPAMTEEHVGALLLVKQVAIENAAEPGHGQTTMKAYVTLVSEILVTIQSLASRKAVLVDVEEIEVLRNRVEQAIGDDDEQALAIITLNRWLGIALCGCGGSGHYEDRATGEDRCCEACNGLGWLSSAPSQEDK